MFDIGFPELVIISVVALVVLGPERLPEALRTLGLWFGRARRSFTAVKTEIEREIGMDDIRRQLHNEAILDEMKRIEDDVHKIGQQSHSASTNPWDGEDEAELVERSRHDSTDDAATTTLESAERTAATDGRAADKGTKTESGANAETPSVTDNVSKEPTKQDSAS